MTNLEYCNEILSIIGNVTEANDAIYNLAFDAYIPRKNGIYGTWIRPEDVKVYEEWIDVLEFITTDLKQEATLLNIYKDNGYWPGNLNLLFTNLTKFSTVIGAFFLSNSKVILP